MLVELPGGRLPRRRHGGAFFGGRALRPRLAVAYALPVATLFLGLLIAAFAGLNEVWQALCALAGLGAGLAVIKILEPRLRRLRPDVRPA